jgi:hypothetical protein
MLQRAMVAVAVAGILFTAKEATGRPETLSHLAQRRMLTVLAQVVVALNKLEPPVEPGMY